MLSQRWRFVTAHYAQTTFLQMVDFISYFTAGIDFGRSETHFSANFISVKLTEVKF